MRLGEVCVAAGLAAAVVQDGEFDALGLLSHRGHRFLVALYEERFTGQLVANSDIACVIATPDLAAKIPAGLGIAVAADAKTVFYNLHSFLTRETEFYWHSFPTEIAALASIHERAFVAPRNVRIGPGCIVDAGSVILERTILGQEVVIRSGAVIGGEGFEPKYVGGRHVTIEHAGGVHLADGVEVQANSHIARAVFGSLTAVGEDSKIDALVQISHNVSIGERCEIAGGAFVGGSTTVGNEVWIGPNATISSEITIGDGAFVTLGAVVTRDVAPGQHVSGNFAVDHARFLAFVKSIR